MIDFTLILFRFSSGVNATLGAMFALEAGDKPAFRCFTCEDEHREVKVAGETRIPAGCYEIKLRAAGSMHPKYAARFPGLHRGMLWLQNVPGFEWVYIHYGNSEKDTAGCILVGRGADAGTTTLSHSVAAYEALYREVLAAMDAGRKVFIDIRDYA